MARDIGASNVTAVTGAHVHVVLLAKLEFDEPVYVHTGYGEITYDSDVYIGVGKWGGISQAKETENLSPGSLVLELDGVSAKYIAEALDSGNYGDTVTIYEGYRQDDGTLVADPWVLWSGFLEFATAGQGSEENVVSLTCQHDLAILNEKDGSRFTDEDQLKRYSGDRFFEYITDMENLQLQWGGLNTGEFKRVFDRVFR